MSSLSKLDQKCLWHPFTQMQTAKEPIVILRGKGCYLYSEEGKAYLDAISSWWVNLHGHAHPYIAEKIAEQAKCLEQVIFADFTHPQAVEFASRLLPLLPSGLTRIFYSDNGSTSVEVAIKMALQYWHNKDAKTKRKRLVCFKSSYHGDTFGAMSVAGKNAFNRPFWSHLFEAATIDPPLLGQEEASLNQLETLLLKEDVALFIFEPLILGAGGMLTYSKHALEQLLQLCEKYEVLTIADEVMTGFGRTGKLFATADFSPDILCLSKGITGGFLPLGATACKEKIFSAFLDTSREKALLHGHSYTANPLSLAAANASLDLTLSYECDLSRKRIEKSHQSFCQKWQGHPKLQRCTYLGTILILEYKNEEKSSYFNSLRDKLYGYFIDQGILLRPLGNVVYVMPPYCIQDAELALIYDHIIKSFDL